MIQQIKNLFSQNNKIFNKAKNKLRAYMNL